jgi:hypothetical protein
MGKMQPKLITRKHWVVGLLILALVSGLNVYQEIRERGEVRAEIWIAVALTTFFFLGIMATVTWWGNRPE